MTSKENFLKMHIYIRKTLVDLDKFKHHIFTKIIILKTLRTLKKIDKIFFKFFLI